MILGRSTVQWTSLITAAGAMIQVVIVQLVPTLDPVVVATLIGSTVVFLGFFIAFLANTETTPSKSPQLVEGTPIQVTDAKGAIIGHAPVPTPDLSTEPTPSSSGGIG